MSFTDRPMLTGRQKFGCASVAVFGIVVTFFGLIGNALGSCPECNPNPILNFMLFPGTAIFFLVVGVSMIWYFLRDKT